MLTPAQSDYRTNEIVHAVLVHSRQESCHGYHNSRSKDSRSTLRPNELRDVDELRILNRHGRIEETVSHDDVSGGAGLFQDADCGFGDHVVCFVVPSRNWPGRAVILDGGRIAGTTLHQHKESKALAELLEL